MSTGSTASGFDLRAIQRVLRRWRRIAYLVAVSAMLIAAPAAEDHHLITGGVLLAAVGLVTGSRSGSLRAALRYDLIAAVGLWWLFGPISGADFIPVYVVAASAFLLPRSQARPLLAMALVTKPVEVGLHFLAGTAVLPLFHPPSLVPNSEFLIGATIQVVILGSRDCSL